MRAIYRIQIQQRHAELLVLLCGFVHTRYLRRIEEGYKANPYHNKTHASYVLQTMHVLIHRGGMIPGYVDPLTHVGCYLAAVRYSCGIACCSR